MVSLAGVDSFAFVVLVALAASGCRESSRPWAGGDADTAGALAPPPESPSAAADPDAGDPESEGGAGGSSPGDEAPLPPPARVGGPWVRCYGNFRISGDPRKDVTRLSLLCGPQNGMRRLSDRAFEGAVVEGGPDVSSTFSAKRGECYRVFAVAEPSVGDLDVEIRTSRGMPVAADHGKDAWPIVQPDRPFCALDDDLLTVIVRARKGSGHFAGEVWRLPAR